MLTLQSVILTAGMIGAAVYDIRNRLVDDRVCWLIALAGLITVSPASLWAQLLGFFCAGLPFYLGSGFGKNGAGDIWLAASAGFVLGIHCTISSLLFGSLFVIAANFLLFLILLWTNTRRVEHAISPILHGIEQISEGKEVSLPKICSKLEYSMQPLALRPVDLLEVVRQVIVQTLESDLDEKYAIDLQTDTNKSHLVQGDASLLTRMLENLIGNSIVHNQSGCNADFILSGALSSNIVKTGVLTSADGAVKVVLNNKKITVEIKNSESGLSERIVMSSDGIEGFGYDNVAKQYIKTFRLEMGDKMEEDRSSLTGLTGADGDGISIAGETVMIRSNLGGLIDINAPTMKIGHKTVSWKDNGNGTFSLIGQ